MAKNPKNVQAVLNWYKQHRPDVLPTITDIFDRNDPAAQAGAALILQGFEAGRIFEREHPNIESGAGYLD